MEKPGNPRSSFPMTRRLAPADIEGCERAVPPRDLRGLAPGQSKSARPRHGAAGEQASGGGNARRLPAARAKPPRAKSLRSGRAWLSARAKAYVFVVSTLCLNVPFLALVLARHLDGITYLALGGVYLLLVALGYYGLWRSSFSSRAYSSSRACRSDSPWAPAGCCW